MRGVLYSAVTPPWQAPDEPDHFQYVAFLVYYHRFPTELAPQGGGYGGLVSSAERCLSTVLLFLHQVGEQVAGSVCRAGKVEPRGHPSSSPGFAAQAPTEQDVAADGWLQAQVYASMQEFDFWARRAHSPAPPTLEKEYRAAVGHPPLYYLLGALLLTPFTHCNLVTQLHILRLMSASLGALTVLVAYLTARTLFPEDVSWQLAVPAFVAFLPMHTFITSSVNNDSLAELLASLVIYTLVKILRTGLSRQRAMSVACLLLLGVLTKRTTTFAIPLAALTVTLPHLIASAVGLSLWISALRLSSPALHPPPSIALSFLLTFASFWANFGWMNVPLDLGWYAALAIVSLLAFCGLGLFALRVAKEATPLEAGQRRALLTLLLAVVLIFAQTFGLIIVRGIHQQGRYLFPALIPLAVFFTLGLREWLPLRHHRLLPLTLVLGMFVLDSVSLYCYILPHFYG